MKTVILCGGFGTRLSEETTLKPKPMVEVGMRPILWHIMKTYAHFGYQDFVLALGYKGHVIKDYFLNYHTLASDLTVNLGQGQVDWIDSTAEDWKVTMVETGYNTLTGGRLHRLEPLLRPHGTFMLTYGDGVSNIDINDLVRFHRQHGKLATVSAVRPSARFGRIVMDGAKVTDFKEKPQAEFGWINGGFFVFEPEVFDYLHGDDTVLEAEPLENLAKDGQLMAYKHDQFWHCMDTLRDRNTLTEMWTSGKAAWKLW